MIKNNRLGNARECSLIKNYGNPDTVIIMCGNSCNECCRRVQVAL